MSHCYTYEETEVTQEQLINCLKGGIKYIYNPDAPNMYKYYSNKYWVEKIQLIWKLYSVSTVIY